MFNYAHPEVLVDTQWVAEQLSNPNVCLIEGGINPDTYKNGHIPGAIFWNAFTELMLPDDRTNFDPACIERLLGRSGITNNSTVIVYGEHPAIGAALFWLLKVFGHQDVRVLNGDRQKWVAEGGLLTTEQPTVTPTQYSVQTVDVDLRVIYEDVRQAMDRKDCVLIDVRSPQEYSGEWFNIKPPVGDERTGHIPGAIHIPYELALNEDGTFKSVEELLALYHSKGITVDKEAIAYCAVGARSAHTCFVLKYLLGYPHVRNYYGSWNEWSRFPDAPIEKNSVR
ncbi:sulfurtransferase [Scytonema sp. UIC 10036]|uniref:sulfurtransferase n=1 Tax=Scytonema sp. UIC 10036 TaxID=2304196 RepID=UPI0012DA6B66|nr:sulfurtransferase [Scytonema sp. UIC 10036]MUH00321.1 sulfurtransferase [Scytonema sp. UIC 10036]